MCVFRDSNPLEPVLSVRVVRVAHLAREVPNEVNLEVGWRYGRAEMLRRAVIAAAFGRGWSMACFFGLASQEQIVVQMSLRRTCSVVVDEELDLAFVMMLAGKGSWASRKILPRHRPWRYWPRVKCNFPTVVMMMV